jgi:DNA-nicking Smr family endonuclease
MSNAKIKTLSDLKAVKAELAAAEKLRLAQARELAAQAARKEAAHNLFARAVGSVKPLPSKDRHSSPAPKPEPVARQQQLDDQAVLKASLSDEFDASSLLDTDEQLSYRRPGIGRDVLTKLRKGGWSVQAQLDLHGLRQDQAREALAAFIKEAHKQGLRCVRVVHGKGLGSPGKTPVLKGRVQSWLVQKNEVLAFVQARPAEGGAGALVVLLSPSSA